ncbi:hypothetical protein CDD83_10359 [Cordyceps sp. RAO-2017]|nr:hypothetical protein CDD83_10359 [Cordyceps sp. RAO-2017]
MLSIRPEERLSAHQCYAEASQLGPSHCCSPTPGPASSGPKDGQTTICNRRGGREPARHGSNLTASQRFVTQNGTAIHHGSEDEDCEDQKTVVLQGSAAGSVDGHGTADTGRRARSGAPAPESQLCTAKRAVPRTSKQSSSLSDRCTKRVRSITSELPVVKSEFDYFNQKFGKFVDLHPLYMGSSLDILATDPGTEKGKSDTPRNPVDKGDGYGEESGLILQDWL